MAGAADRSALPIDSSRQKKVGHYRGVREHNSIHWRTHSVSVFRQRIVEGGKRKGRPQRPLNDEWRLKSDGSESDLTAIRPAITGKADAGKTEQHHRPSRWFRNRAGTVCERQRHRLGQIGPRLIAEIKRREID